MMFRPWFVALGVTLVLGTVAASDPPSDKLNRPVGRLSLTDGDGKSIVIEPAPGREATVIVFLSFECPVSNSYIDQLSTLAKKFSEKGAIVYGVVAGETDPEALRKTATEFRLTFPLLVDPKFQVADALKATTVPEAFVLDHNMVLRYRGRIDDGYSARLKRNRTVTSHDLIDALDALLAGRAVKTPVTTAIGCPIGTRDLTAKPGARTDVTYHRDVAPILQANCQGCHRPGQVGPFSLTNYRQAVNWAEDIRDFTRDRRMPPWKPVGGPGYANERKMSDADIATLTAWVDAGCPEGNSKDAPPARKFSDEWQLGPPDLILNVPEDFHVGPSGVDLFRCFVIPTGLTEDRHVVAIEVKPGNPRVVHHVLNFFDCSGSGRALEAKEKSRTRTPNEQDHGPGYSSAMGVGFIPQRSNPPKFGGLGGWAPGQLASQLPEGAGYFLPKGADLIVQTHYHRTGKPETDRTRVGLYFAKKPVEKDWQTISVNGLGLTNLIPPGKSDYRATGTVWVMNEATLHSVIGHMHMVGREIKVTMTPPDGEPVTILNIPDWDYNWQETYWFKKPIAVKAGTRFDVSARYDNSKANPNNPFNPPRWIYFGEQTTNEMLIAFLGVTPAGQERVRISRLDPAKRKD